MEAVLEIFKQLGADQSFFIQFGIFAAVFILAKFLFLDHLQNIIETREEKTVKLEGSTDKKIDQVNKLSNEYKEKITNTHKEIKNKIEAERASIAKELEAKYRQEEKEINQFVEQSRQNIIKEMNNKKELIMAEADQLAGDLVQKLQKGN